MGIFQRTFEHLARAAAAAGTLLFSASPVPAGDNVLGYEAGEPALAEATRLAHARLPRFFELAKSRVEASYLVKIALTWQTDTNMSGPRSTGFATAFSRPGWPTSR